MSTYRAEILGVVPNGLSHNDVFASVLSMMREHDSRSTVTKRRLAGNMISLIVRYRAVDHDSATRIIRSVSTGVNHFSSDVIGPREVR